MNKWTTAFTIILGLFLLAIVLSGLFTKGATFTGDTIAVIPIEGIISSTSSTNILSETTTTPQEILEKIDMIKKDDKVKAVIIEINSPGGAAVASQEIADAIKNLNKTKYAVIKDVGASGGYWIASATDKIYASQVSITGSIGVLASYLQFSSLFDKYGITYEKITGGENKDMGSPYRKPTKEELELFNKKIGIIHKFFIKEVAENRKLDGEKLKQIATGEFYTGIEAKELGLIDEFGNTQEVYGILKKEKNIPKAELVYLRKEKGIIDTLLGASAYNVGRGIATELKTTNQNKIKIEI